MTAVAALEGVEPEALGDRFEIEYAKVRPMEGLAGLGEIPRGLARPRSNGGRA